MGRAPLVDFCNRIDPRARTAEHPNPAHRINGRPLAQLFPRMATLGPVDARPLAGASRWSAASRDVTGQGLEARALTSHFASGTSHRDRSRRELRPNPIGSGTSCHKLVALQAGESCFARHRFRVPLSSLPGAHSLRVHAPVGCRSACGRSTSLRAASHTFPRRAARSAAPKVPSVVG